MLHPLLFTLLRLHLLPVVGLHHNKYLMIRRLSQTLHCVRKWRISPIVVTWIRRITVVSNFLLWSVSHLSQHVTFWSVLQTRSARSRPILLTVLSFSFKVTRFVPWISHKFSFSDLINSSAERLFYLQKYNKQKLYKAIEQKQWQTTSSRSTMMLDTFNS